MPISRYDIVVATHPKELNALMADGGYVAIGYICAQPSYGLQAVGEGVIDPWGSVTDYELVQAQFYKDLITLVNEKIAEGYQPIGGLAHWANAFVQAVGKVEAYEGSGGDGSLPAGNQYDVLTYGKDKKASAAPLSLSTWIREELPVSAGGEELIPVTMTAPNNGSPALQAYRSLGASPEPDSVMMRDAYGKTQVADGTSDFDAVNLKQAQEMIETSKQWLIDNIYDIINNGVGKR